MTAALALWAILLPGMALVAWAFPKAAHRRAEIWFRLCAAALLGLGLWSAAWAATGFACGLTMIWLKDATLAVLGAAGLALCRRTEAFRSEPDRLSAPLELRACLWLAAAACALAFLEHGERFPDGGWDAVHFWNLRARDLSRGGMQLGGIGFGGVHADYPLLLPGLVAQAYALCGRETPAAALAVHFALGALLVFLLVSAVASLRGAEVSAMAGLAILSAPALVDSAWSQYADLPLAAFVLLTVTLAAHALARGGASRALYLAGLAASLAAWTKNEGLVSAFAAALALLIASGPRALAAFATGVFPVSTLLIWFKLQVTTRNDLLAATTPASAISQLLDPHRLLAVLAALLRELAHFADWGFAVPAAAMLFLVLLQRARRDLASLFAAMVTILGLAAIAVIYLVTPWDLAWHLRTSLSRLLFQCLPLLLFALSLVAAGKADAAASPTAS